MIWILTYTYWDVYSISSNYNLLYFESVCLYLIYDLFIAFRFCEYILECPTAEVRQAFVRIIVFIAHFSLNDGQHALPAILQQQLAQEKANTSGGSVKSADATSGQATTSATGSSVVAAGTGTNPAEIKEQQTLSDYLLQIVLSLLWMEVPEHGKHLSQYFSLFVMYASLGIPEKKQLLK